MDPKQPAPAKNPVRRPVMSEAERRRRMQEEAEQEAKDREFQKAAERFKRSPENDSPGYNCGGMPKKYAKGGAVRRDGIAQRGRTKGRMV